MNGASAWIPNSTNNNNDYLQIDLGSVYFVCAVATQGNPSAGDWTKTYKIETSLDNVKWKMYQENNVVKVLSLLVMFYVRVHVFLVRETFKDLIEKL